MTTKVFWERQSSIFRSAARNNAHITVIMFNCSLECVTKLPQPFAKVLKQHAHITDVHFRFVKEFQLTRDTDPQVLRRLEDIYQPTFMQLDFECEHALRRHFSLPRTHNISVKKLHIHLKGVPHGNGKNTFRDGLLVGRDGSFRCPLGDRYVYLKDFTFTERMTATYDASTCKAIYRNAALMGIKRLSWSSLAFSMIVCDDDPEVMGEFIRVYGSQIHSLGRLTQSERFIASQGPYAHRYGLLEHHLEENKSIIVC